jgi:hypothetical protein
MSDDTRLYISVESSNGHLVIDGPMTLWRELVGSLSATPTEVLPSVEHKTVALGPAAEARS